MKLLKVNFEKYKSITGDDLDIDDSITCLVGINESGKSNVLFALEKINPSEQFTTSELSRFSEEYGDDTKSPSVKIWLKPNRDEEKELATIFGKQVGVLVVTKKFNNYSIDFPAIDYKKSKYYPKKEPAKPLAVEPKPQENINPEQNPDSSPQPAEQASEVPAQEIKAVPEITEEQILENIRLQIVEEIKSKYIPKFSRFDSVNFNDFYLPLNGEVHINKLISDPGKYTPVVNLLSLGNITSLDKLKASNDEERIRRD